MNYTDAILWYLSWPVLIYVAYRFVWLNIQHHGRMERLQKLEKNYGDAHDKEQTASANSAR